MNTKGQNNLSSIFQGLPLNRGMAFGVIIITALFAFEIFNYSTTDFALSDLLGDLRFLGVRWATILAIAFCGIDFAGIARLFTPESGDNQPNETWYLFGAWLLAATMNAMLTWWGVSLAVLNHQTLGNEVVERETLLRAAPIFVAVLVWLIRVLMIGTFSVAGDHLFAMGEARPRQISRTAPRPALSASRPSLPAIPAARSLSARSNTTSRRPVSARPVQTTNRSASTASVRSMRTTPPPPPEPPEPVYSRPEPTYHPFSAAPGSPDYEVIDSYPQRNNTATRKF